MKKNDKHRRKEEEHEAEILRAVAQAWHGHSITSKTSASTSEFDAHRQYFKSKPTRFKLEATSMVNKRDQCGTSWDFGQSLWDSYEILSVSKKLETGLILDDPFATLNEQDRNMKRPRESRNSLRSLFNKMSSRRFTETE